MCAAALINGCRAAEGDVLHGTDLQCIYVQPYKHLLPRCCQPQHHAIAGVSEGEGEGERGDEVKVKVEMRVEMG